MLVKELIVYLQELPLEYEIALSLPLIEDMPFLVEIYKDDFTVNTDLGVVEIDSSISDCAAEQLEEMVEGNHLERGDVLFLSRAEVEKTVKERMQERGMSLVIS